MCKVMMGRWWPSVRFETGISKAAILGHVADVLVVSSRALPYTC
jgi:hypothetical protein